MVYKKWAPAHFLFHYPPLFKRIYLHPDHYVQEPEQQSRQVYQMCRSICPELAEEVNKEVNDYQNRSPHGYYTKYIHNCIWE